MGGYKARNKLVLGHRFKVLNWKYGSPGTSFQGARLENGGLGT